MKAVDRFLDAARLLAHDVEVRRFPEGTKTAEDAARAIGCELGQIVKTLVFMADDRPILALTSGVNRADVGKLRDLTASAHVRRATADEVRTATGFPIGGTPPLMAYPHRDKGAERIRAFIDETLMRYAELWAGAGAPDAVFRLTPADLLRLTEGRVASFAE